MFDDRSEVHFYYRALCVCVRACVSMFVYINGGCAFVSRFWRKTEVKLLGRRLLGSERVCLRVVWSGLECIRGCVRMCQSVCLLPCLASVKAVYIGPDGGETLHRYPDFPHWTMDRTSHCGVWETRATGAASWDSCCYCRFRLFQLNRITNCQKTHVWSSASDRLHIKPLKRSLKGPRRPTTFKVLLQCSIQQYPNPSTEYSYILYNYMYLKRLLMLVELSAVLLAKVVQNKWS